jgi:hypothetical protein
LDGDRLGQGGRRRAGDPAGGRETQRRRRYRVGEWRNRMRRKRKRNE